MPVRSGLHERPWMLRPLTLLLLIHYQPKHTNNVTRQKRYCYIYLSVGFFVHEIIYSQPTFFVYGLRLWLDIGILCLTSALAKLAKKNRIEEVFSRHLNLAKSLFETSTHSMIQRTPLNRITAGQSNLIMLSG